jgi:hypothetical protein
MPKMTTTPAPGVIHIQTILPRQIITQTITYADYTTTAIVTLGNTAAPVASDSSSQGSDDLSGSDIGIIIGSIVGAVVLGLLIWLCVVIRRRTLEANDYDSGDEIIATVEYPRPTYWPRFPTSIPPPVVPHYYARPRPRTYTASDEARRGTTSYY